MALHRRLRGELVSRPSEPQSHDDVRREESLVNAVRPGYGETKQLRCGDLRFRFFENRQHGLCGPSSRQWEHPLGGWARFLIRLCRIHEVRKRPQAWRSIQLRQGKLVTCRSNGSVLRPALPSVVREPWMRGSLNVFHRLNASCPVQITAVRIRGPGFPRLRLLRELCVLPVPRPAWLREPRQSRRRGLDGLGDRTGFMAGRENSRNAAAASGRCLQACSG